MAFIGRSPVYGAYEVQTLTPDSSTTTFTLTYAVGSAPSIMVFYGGVYQIPNSAYSLSGGGLSITFSEAPVTGTSLIVVFLGLQLSVARTAGQETSIQSFTGDGSTTAFTLTDLPVVPTGLIVFVDGIQQKLTSNYSVSGNNVVFTSAPDASSEIDVYTLVKEKVSIDTVGDGTITLAKLNAGIQKSVGQYYEISSNTTAVASRYYMVNTSGGAITLTLPASPTMGDTVRVLDATSSFGTNNLTIGRNTNKIQGDAADMTVSTTDAAFDLVYYNATYGWRLFSV
jgi:hypothetical protein